MTCMCFYNHIVVLQVCQILQILVVFTLNIVIKGIHVKTINADSSKLDDQIGKN